MRESDGGQWHMVVGLLRALPTPASLNLTCSLTGFAKGGCPSWNSDVWYVIWLIGKGNQYDWDSSEGYFMPVFSEGNSEWKNVLWSNLFGILYYNKIS